MAQPTIQTSFASGEWAPKLRSRVDIQKYHSGAALLRNFYVDFSGGGASTRQGTKFIHTCKAFGSRLIPFQPSTTVSYVLEFGQNYVRFYSNGAIILKSGVPYTITSPYNASDLFPNPVTGNPGLKFVQNVTSLIITHPSYPTQVLTIVSSNNWTLTAAAFNPTIQTPTGVAATTSLSTLSPGWNYGYIVTAVDANGQESGPSLPVTLSGYALINNTVGANNITWNAVSNAVSYNIYKIQIFNATPPSGSLYGFIGNTTGTSFYESYPGIAPSFAQTPPIINNPFSGASVTALTLTANSTYGAVPGVNITPPPAGGVPATGIVSLTLNTDSINSGGTGYIVGDIIFCAGGVVFTVASVSAGGVITSVVLNNGGSITGVGTAVPSNPVAATGGTGTGASFILGWNIGNLALVSGGSGYLNTPTVSFTSGGAAATATLGPASQGNPGVPGFFQQRLALAGQALGLQTYNFSQPGSFFNFNISDPIQPSDAITGSIISEELNDIRSLVTVQSGLLALTGHGAWVISGGSGLSVNNPITPSNQSANPQAFNGANDLRPQRVNFDILYITNKGNYVRDLAYNIYAAIYTGSDISVLSNHLFFGFSIIDWAWSEEPFKTMWAIRNDGVMLSLGYVKEQDLIGWAHHDTDGQFLSVCSVIENVNGNIVDAVYVIVQRFVNGSTVQYVERMADRYFPYGAEDSWSVDCALQTAPAITATTTLSMAGDASAIGNPVTLVDSGVTFGGASVGQVVRAGGGIYTITSITSNSQVAATVAKVPTLINQYTNVPFSVTGYTIWQKFNATTGLGHLANKTVVGVGDGVAIPPTVVSSGGVVTLPPAVFPNGASKMTIGLAFTPDLQTLPLDLGEPTVQGKRKKIAALTLRVADTLGLEAGTSFSTVVPMKDFTLGNVGSQSNQNVTDLTSGDGRIIIDQTWQELGSYCIRQNQPYPATVLGVMPEVVVGDTPK